MLHKPPIGAPCNGCGLCCQAQVCGTGSFALGLVGKYGERAPGPCPALKNDGDKFVCGLVLRPKDFIESQRGVMPLREAVMLLIGAGAGCDEAGDEPDTTALPKLRKIQDDYLEKHGVAAFQRAAEIVLGGKQ